MSLKQTGYVKYDKTPGPDAPAKYIPAPIGVTDGHFDYPSSKGQGVDVISYPRRGKSPHEIQVGRLPAFVRAQLIQAHRQGRLREELNHHIGALKGSGVMAEGILELLREQERKISGHIARDEAVVDEVGMILGSCTPAARG